MLLGYEAQPRRGTNDMDQDEVGSRPNAEAHEVSHDDGPSTHGPGGADSIALASDTPHRRPEYNRGRDTTRESSTGLES